MLRKEDSGWVRKTIVEVLSKYGLSEQEGEVVERHCRVSKAGNIVLADKLLLFHNLFYAFHVHSKDMAGELLRRMKSFAAEEIIQCVRDLSNYTTSCQLKDWKCRELTPDDFDIDVEEITEEEKEMLRDRFYKAHDDYISTLRNHIDKLFTGLGKDAFEILVPADVLKRLNCKGDLRSIDFDKKELAFLLKCSCGISGKLNTFLCQVVNDKWADITKCEKEIVEHRFDTYESFQLLTKVDFCCSQAEDTARAYFLTKNARSKLEELRTLKSALRKPSQIKYSVESGLWGVGSKKFPDITAETIYEAAQSALQDVRNGKLLSKEGVKERIKEAWGFAGKESYDEAGRIWSGLPFFTKMRVSVASAYTRLVSFANACANGEVIVSQRGDIIVGEATIDTDSEKKFIENMIKIYLDKFKNAVNSAGTVGYDQYIMYQVLRVVAEHQEKMGVTTVAALLTGSKSQKIMNSGYNRSSSYGILKGVITQKDLANLIKNMVQDGFLSIKYVGWHDMPVLRVPEVEKRHLESIPPPEGTPGEGKQVTYTVEETVNKRAWDRLAEMAKESWPAEAALRTAALLWPSGKAAKAVKALFAEQ